MVINKKSIQQQLMDGQIKNAIQMLLSLSQKYDDDMYEGAIMLSGNFNGLERNVRKGVLDDRTAQTRKMQIKNSISGYLRDVESDWSVEDKDLELEKPAPPSNDLQETTPRKILFLAANPRDTQPLQLDKEVRQITQGLERSKHRDDFKLEQKWAVQIDDLRRAFLDEQPSIVHFSGHGSEEGRIILQSPIDTSQELPIQALSGFFKIFKETVECVLLNACYSEKQARLIAEHIPYVIGMSDAIYDQAALAFSTAFYDALGNGRDIPFAFELAVNTIEMYGVPNEDVPVLIQQKKGEDTETT